MILSQDVSILFLVFILRRQHSYFDHTITIHLNLSIMTCSESEAEALCYLALVINATSEDRKRKLPRVWVKNWLNKKKKLSHTRLIKELSAEPLDYRNYLRMPEEIYSNLLALVTPFIKKQDTVMREAISPHERLCATLRYLAEGKSQTSLQYTTAISRQTLGRIIPETCKAIYEVLKDKYMKFPDTEEEMRKMADEFKHRWQFPNCLGAVDGKHIKIVPPPSAGSHFYNYKNFHSVVLMAIVNADYEFIYVDVGTNGRISDGGVIKKTEFYKRLDEGTLNIPPPEKPTEDSDPLPFVYIGDEAFALRPDFLKPYPQRQLDNDKRIYNYRLSRARRIVENAFGILAARFQIFHSAINFISIEHINVVVLACCALHNYLRCKSKHGYVSPADHDIENHTAGTIEMGLRSDGILEPLENSHTRNSTNDAKKVREDFVKYFNNTGTVPWQDRMINT